MPTGNDSNERSARPLSSATTEASNCPLIENRRTTPCARSPLTLTALSIISTLSRVNSLSAIFGVLMLVGILSKNSKQSTSVRRIVASWVVETIFTSSPTNFTIGCSLRKKHTFVPSFINTLSTLRSPACAETRRRRKTNVNRIFFMIS